MSLHVCLNCPKLTNNPKFCSSSCSASFNNSRKPKRQRIIKTCKTCTNDALWRRKFCEQCISKKSEKKRKKIPYSEVAEYQRNYQRDKYQRWIREAKEQLGGKCVKCGSTENLQFDHIDPSTKSFALSSRRPTREEWDKELAKCQLLCFDCHKKKTRNELAKDVHGTWGMYTNSKCRCEVCREFFNKYMREYKKRKREEKKQIHAPID